MTTASDEWIQESLARLESMEEERQQHEAALESATDPDRLRFHSQEVERLEVEIRNLYQSLEAVADGQEVPDEAPAQAYEQPAQPAYEQPAAAYEQPAAAYEQPAQPAQPAFAQPAQPAFQQPAQPAFQQPAFQQPAFQQPAGPAFGGGPDPGMSGMDDLDLDKPKKSGALWGAIVVGVLALAGGGYFFMQGQDKPVEETKPAGPVKVIGGGDVPPDTQGPKAAKGKNVDSSSGTVFKEGSGPRPGGARPSGGGGGGSSKKKKKDQVKITKTDDPLAGLD